MRSTVQYARPLYRKRKRTKVLRAQANLTVRTKAIITRDWPAYYGPRLQEPKMLLSKGPSGSVSVYMNNNITSSLSRSPSTPVAYHCLANNDGVSYVFATEEGDSRTHVEKYMPSEVTPIETRDMCTLAARRMYRALRARGFQKEAA